MINNILQIHKYTYYIVSIIIDPIKFIELS